MKRVLLCEGLKRNNIEITPKIIDELVETFDTLNYKPPIVLGHISQYRDGDPAYGRLLEVEKIQRLSDGKLCLTGELKFTSYAKNLVEEGAYDGISLGLRQDPETGKYYIHHIALLGAYPPADQFANKSVEETVHFSSEELEEIIEIKLSNTGGKQMDIKDIIQSDEFKKSIAQIVQDTVKKELETVNMSTKEEQEKAEKKDDKSLEKLYKQEKIQRLKDIALSVGMGEEGIKALEQFGQLLKPVINLSDGTEFSPFDLLEKALKDIKPRDKEDLFKDINLSSSSEDDILDTSEVAKMFTTGGDK